MRRVMRLIVVIAAAYIPLYVFAWQVYLSLARKSDFGKYNVICWRSDKFSGRAGMIAYKDGLGATEISCRITA